jgi:hypothetical protein
LVLPGFEIVRLRESLNKAMNEADFGLEQVEGQFFFDKENPQLAVSGGILQGVSGRVRGRSEGRNALPEQGYRLVRVQQADE